MGNKVTGVNIPAVLTNLFNCFIIVFVSIYALVNF